MNERSIFEQALEYEDESARNAFLSDACSGDVNLRSQIDSLLLAHAKECRVLDDRILPSVETGDRSEAAEIPMKSIGPYEVREKIGEGGMGVVYVAEQTEPVQRKVALKIIKPGMDTKEVIARFEAERQALAFMEHPNIARVLAAGTTDGRPYFVMELVRGIPITEYCDHVKATARERLELFQTVCDAVQHAHQKGIIHRDIKPSNVLVTQVGAKPVVKVIDFGLAKAISGQRLTEKTLYTGFMKLMGTPAYMSPEQAGLSGLDVDTRSDIYSLGVLLYELLTGTTPLDKTEIQSQAYDELCRRIREVDAPKPSTRFSTLQDAQRTTIARQRQVDQNGLRQLLHGDLDRVVLKAVEKDRERRYGSPQELAADIERFLEDKPVQAVAPSQWYLARKYIRRNRVTILTATAILILLCATTVVSTWQAVQVSRANQEVEQERNAAVASEQRATNAKQVAILSERNAKAARDRAKLTSEEHRRLSYCANLYLADQLWHSPSGTRQEVQELLLNWMPLGSQPDLRDFAWRYQWTRLNNNAIHTVEDSRAATISTGGDFTILNQQGVHEWNEGRKELTQTWHGNANQLSSCGRWVVARDSEVLQIVDLSSGKVRIESNGNRCRFSVGGKFALTWSQTDDKQPRDFQMWDLSTGNTLPLSVDLAAELRNSRDGMLGSVGPDGDAFFIHQQLYPKVFLPGRSQAVSWKSHAHVRCSAWSPNTQFVAYGQDDGKIVLRTVIGAGDDAVSFRSHHEPWRIAFSPESKRMAIGSDDGSVEIWDISSFANLGDAKDTDRRIDFSRIARPTLIHTLKAHTGVVHAVSFSPDGTKLATCSSDGEASVWNIDNPAGDATVSNLADDLYRGGLGLELEDGPNGVRVGHVIHEQNEELRDRVRKGDQILAIIDQIGHHEVTPNMDWYDVRRMIPGPFNSNIKLRVKSSATNETGIIELRRAFERPAISTGLQFFPDGRSIAVAERSLGAFTLTVGGRPTRRYPTLPSSVAISPNGKYLAMDDFDDLVLWDLEKDELYARLNVKVRQDENAYAQVWGALAFSPDSNYLAMGTGYRYNKLPKRSDLKVWDIATRNQVRDRPLLEADSVLGAVAFTPNGEHLLAGQHDGTLQVWNTTDWTLERSLNADVMTTAVAVSPDGNTIAQGGNGITLWDLDAGEKRSVIRNAKAFSLAFSPQGNTLVSTDNDGRVFMWDVETGLRICNLGGHTGVVTGCDFSPNGNLLATIDLQGSMRMWNAMPLSDIDQHSRTNAALLRRGIQQHEDGQHHLAVKTLKRVLRAQASPPARAALKKSLKALGKYPKILMTSSQVAIGSSVDLRVAFENHDEDERTYQWFRDGNRIDGATGATFEISHVTDDHFGRYHVEVTDDTNFADSSQSVYLADSANPIARGGLCTEVFKDVKGIAIDDLTLSTSFPDQPSSSDSITSFEIPRSLDHDYGVRVSGFIIPRETGDYIFYLCSDDSSQLFVSSDESAANQEMVANHSGWNRFRGWESLEGECISKPIHLLAGRRYSIRALYKQGRGDDHLSVAWRMAGEPPPKDGDPPISGEFLQYRLE